jgi:hypothetical protein
MSTTGPITVRDICERLKQEFKQNLKGPHPLDAFAYVEGKGWIDWQEALAEAIQGADHALGKAKP